MPHAPLRSAFPVLLAAALVGGCGGDPTPAVDVPPADAPGEVAEDPMDGLQLVVGIDRASYAPSAPIQVRVRVLNRHEEPRTLAFRDGKRVDAVLEDEEGVEIARWSDDMMFTQALGEETIEPGDTGRSWELELSAPEAPGNYRIRGVLEAIEGRLEASIPVQVSAGG